MKRNLYASLLILFVVACQFSFGQTSVRDTFNFDGFERDYILYIPSLYDGTTAVPLVINLHGYGSNNLQQQLYGSFIPQANEDNFLVVHPNGTLDLTGTRYWNAFLNSGAVDDVAFINELIDRLSTQYNIDQSQIFSTGMSNGGFMSYKLACELNNRIAKIASVTGSMNTVLETTCAPTAAVPVMQIHGTADLTVQYNGSLGVMAIEDVVDFWVAENNCDPVAQLTQVPNINTTDNSTAELYYYGNGDNGSEVFFYKVIGGGHTWPDAPIELGGNVTNRDFNASQVIWNFFKGESTVGIAERLDNADLDLRVLASTVEFTLSGNNVLKQAKIFNALGQEVVAGNSTVLETNNLTPGVYFLKVETDKGFYSQSFLK